MNHIYKKIGYSSMIAILLSSCAKPDFSTYFVEKPESVLVQEDIDSYAPLISYLDQDANPDFKWGAAINISDYLNKGVIYRLINRNFGEVVTGNAMKHFAVVQDDGSLNLSNIEQLIEVAAANNISLYGHTLCWHAGQNATYLNSLIAPVVIPGTGGPTLDPNIISNSTFETDIEPWGGWGNNSIREQSADGEGYDNVGHALKLTNPSAVNSWEAQLAYDWDEPLLQGEKYVLTLQIKGSKSATIGAGFQNPENYGGMGDYPAIPVTTDWEEVTLATTVSGENAKRFLINYGAYDGTIYIDNIMIQRENPEGAGGVSEAGYALEISNPSVVNAWEAQTAYDLTDENNQDMIEANTEYILKIAAKGSKAGNISIDLQSTSNYQGNGFGALALTAEYQEYELRVTTTAVRNRLIINHGQYDGTIFIDDVRLAKAGSSTNLIANADFENGISGWGGWGNNSTRKQSAEGQGYGGPGGGIIEKTPEEKEQIISQALETFIAGMMGVTKGHVKAWDVVNEPMSDWPDQYALKTGVGKADMAEDEFYWQDYLGKDYAVKAIQYARQYGNSDDKLFINDYGLEGGGDKCEGLIAYVNYVESKGVTVDGIGTQMHIDINTSKDNIINMYELLAATGKLIKVSELDIGLGNNTQTPNATAEQYAAQAEMYKFVIEKYFEIIPKAQQYGITIWGPLDSPNSEYSFWRKGEPIGLWTETFVRKPAYQAVAEALEKQK